MLYPKSLDEAKEIQYILANRVHLYDEQIGYHRVGGMDVSNSLYDPAKMVYGAAITLDANNPAVLDEASSGLHQPFPYIPGFLGFREAPPLVDAFKKLNVKPDIILVDGHGISHPRRLGIASHIGVLLDIPTIGVAKNILVGSAKEELGPQAGDRTPLMWQGEQIGMLLRTKVRCKPLIISAGHRITLETACEVVLKNLTKYRLPEATRHAHLAANSCRKRHTVKST